MPMQVTISVSWRMFFIVCYAFVTRPGIENCLLAIIVPPCGAKNPDLSFSLLCFVTRPGIEPGFEL